MSKLVMGNPKGDVDWNNSHRITGVLEEGVTTLKKELTGDLLIFGSALLCQALMKADLIDEYRLGVAPHLHGRGRPLFERGIPETNLTLTSLRRLGRDGVVLTYEKADPGKDGHGR